MALVLNVSDLSKIVAASDPQSPDLNINENSHFIIIYNGDTIKKNMIFYADMILEKDRNVSCRFDFTVTNYCLHGKLQFYGEIQNQQHEITLYYINSKWELQFLETLNLSNVIANFNYYFSQQYKFFTFNGLEENKFINGYLYLYCKITTKDISRIKLEIPKNEMHSQFASFYKEKLFTDFKIICQNEEFLVHKLVLAARSSVFRAMFEHQMLESQKNEVTINDFKPEIVEEMVYYIYNDEIKAILMEEELQKLLMIADKYALETLKILCMKEMTKYVDNISEALEAFTIAKSYNVTNFKEAVLNFIKDNQHMLLK